MASDETMTIHSSMQEDDYEDDIFYGFDHDQHPNPLNLSRLSVCTSSSMYGNDDDDDDDVDVGDNGMRMFISRLSIESFDADEEFSDDKEGKELTGLLSDSDNELGCFSLPATPPRRRNRGGLLSHQQVMGLKEYASENEAQKGVLGKQDKSRNNARRRRRIVRDRWMLENKGSTSTCDYFDCNNKSKNSNYFSGESDQGGVNGGAGLMVITRPKGGRRSLCMDLDEVKACRDLGFELEHERMLEMPSHRSVSGSTLDTSSGGNSPIANWRISSPGDDPRDVKARLKVWAQAVAIASASPRQGN
ncbi:hypothetical protein SO802_032973 [Lithocarpus litseifolius]|uniref:Fold protein n=1 Tax=Lithocarpus litseifolius TaxID=425828 RepID=A0AAW2BDI1_9ROSI